MCCGALGAWAQIPVAVDAELARAKVPRDAVALLVLDAQNPTATPRLNHRAGVPMQSASVIKLATTFAALELLGPTFTWSTPVYVDGTVRAGVLRGNVYIQGQGDPKLVLERLWLLLHRLQGFGIHSIQGDIVLDRAAFAVDAGDPGAFDGEPLRPYNASPDALLINYKSVLIGFTPDPQRAVAHVQLDPPLWGVQTQDTVPLISGSCGDYRGALKATLTDPTRIRFAGAYPADCGEKVWPVAYADPASYAPRAVQGLWLSMGGQLSGEVRYGQVPAALVAGAPTLELRSPPLAEIVRDINKFSNNVMAQQLFLTLGRESAGTPASLGTARTVMERWWQSRVSTTEPLQLDNGSGLSRQEFISARALGQLLQTAYRSPLMPELMASLPISGVDGTLKRAKVANPGSAHLKTGSLNGVSAIAGYVHGSSGKRYVLVALANHPNAHAARAAFDALVDWAAQDTEGN
ncbi:MAG: D-alanyl-D-alanine carboxypeptidase/D-alanyl-D-alanine-endopeptidase [Rhodoferax sp.]|nr:D-alanyl-D-alanine carboxypeptidase/D-alanyl-D-alanine-endopeptidase [Rhodoferax sp.]